METSVNSGATSTSKQSMAFQAEVKEILNLMVHSLYSQREIFLRELISNASDAMDKLRVEALTHPDWKLSTQERHILIVPDSDNKILTLQDNGIGMSHEEVVKNIGTIAHSGTREFLKAKAELKDRPELIGQFGVGFYSAFMVADKVVLHTQKAGENEGTVWESSGDGTYSLSSAPRAEGHGTTITLKLKDFSQEEDPQDFTDKWTLKSIVKKYSDFIAYPVKLKTKEKIETPDDKKDNKKDDIKDVTAFEWKEEVANSQKAIWLKSPSEIKDEEYKEFYKHVSHDWSDPLKHIHYKAEGTQEFSALLYIPSQVPFDYNYRETKFGLNLYVKRVFIMDRCEDLVPHYMRFLKGVVDSSDLSLNVSREILQKNQQVQQIRKALINKTLGFLKDLQKKERKDYESFWKNFGVSIKEGVATDYANKEKLLDLLLVKSTNSDDWSTLEEYISRMKPEQKSIYYISGDSSEQLKNSPYMEKLKNKGFEVILFTDAVDEWSVRELNEYKGKKLISITGDQLDIDTEEEKKAKEEEKKKAEESLGDLKGFIQKTLDTQVKEVRFSDRLVDSPVCLVSQGHDPSARMERLLESMGQQAPKAKRILEINPAHKVFEKMKTLSEGKKSEWVEILYNQALLNEGSPVQDPGKLCRQITALMTE